MYFYYLRRDKYARRNTNWEVKPIWFNVILHTKLNCHQQDSKRSITISNLLNSESRFSFTPQLCQELLSSADRYSNQEPLP